MSQGANPNRDFYQNSISEGGYIKRILQFSILGLAVVFGAAVDAQTVPLNQQKTRVSPAWITDGVMV